MWGEDDVLRGKLKGYLFEIVILELLRKNGFERIDVKKESKKRVKETREGFIELKGRGCWHQIDCPCDYNRLIPFAYPLRLLGEVKFFKREIDKAYIREYIGILRDIQENYFVTDKLSKRESCSRKMEIGVYFSANGFQKEAEKLAYAHGIKTISYENNYIINRIKNIILELEEQYLSVKCIEKNKMKTFRKEISDAILFGSPKEYINVHSYWMNGFSGVLESLHEQLLNIRTSFIATTATGVFLHFVGYDYFPSYLFEGTDEGRCRVYYGIDNFGIRYFWMEISEDIERRKFYFTPPQSLDYAAIYGNEIVLDEKARIFRELNVNIQLDGKSRNLKLRIDMDWLDVIQNRKPE